MTRVDNWPFRARRVAIIVALLLCGLSIMTPQTKVRLANSSTATIPRDADLYHSIIARVSKGEGYYHAAATEQRLKDYPLRPFVTVRPPSLAIISAWLGEGGAIGALAVLALLTILAWTIRFRQTFARLAILLPILPLVFSVMAISGPVLVLFHESWAALLIALSLALWQPGRWRLAVIIGIIATFFRETAAAYLLLMLAGAIFDRRWREAFGWGAGLLIFTWVLWLHAGAVAGATSAADAASPGWSGLGGWPLFLSAVKASSPLTVAPTWLANLLIPLSLIGWASWANPLGLRVTGLLCGYGLMIMLFARPDNWYWALLLCPLLLTGLGLMPDFLKAWRSDLNAVKPAE